MTHKRFILLFAGIFIICAVLCIYFPHTKSSITAEIYSNGVLIKSINLGDVEQAYEIPVVSDNHKNIILVEHNQISVTDADCPDKLCIQRGTIRDDSYPIVCLPNRLVVQIKSDRETPDVPDALSK